MSLPKGQNPYTQISSEQIYARKYVRFMKDMVKIGEHTKDYSYSDIANGVGIVAINEKQEIALVGQWRYPVKQYNWEIPAGMREDGEDPLATAKRELKEEAGLTAQKWQKLGEFFMEPSSTTKVGHIFLAQELQQGNQSLDDDERINVEWLPLKEILALIEKGEIKDGFTILGILRAQSYL